MSWERRFLGREALEIISCLLGVPCVETVPIARVRSVVVVVVVSEGDQIELVGRFGDRDFLLRVPPPCVWRFAGVPPLSGARFRVLWSGACGFFGRDPAGRAVHINGDNDRVHLQIRKTNAAMVVR